MSKNKEPRPRRTFSPELKQQIVDLYRGGKRKCDIIREYDIASSLLDKWIAQANNSGSFKEKDNRSTEDTELLRLRREIQQLKMENDILKQAALILGLWHSTWYSCFSSSLMYLESCFCSQFLRRVSKQDSSNKGPCFSMV
jgi:transposase